MTTSKCSLAVAHTIAGGPSSGLSPWLLLLLVVPRLLRWVSASRTSTCTSIPSAAAVPNEGFRYRDVNGPALGLSAGVGQAVLGADSGEAGGGGSAMATGRASPGVTSAAPVATETCRLVHVSLACGGRCRRVALRPTPAFMALTSWLASGWGGGVCSSFALLEALLSMTEVCCGVDELMTAGGPKESGLGCFWSCLPGDSEMQGECQQATLVVGCNCRGTAWHPRPARTGEGAPTSAPE